MLYIKPRNTFAADGDAANSSARLYMGHLALERGASRPVAAPSRQPLAQRNPLMLWKIIAAASLAVNLVLLLKLLH